MLRFQLFGVIFLCLIGLSACADQEDAAQRATPVVVTSDHLVDILLTDEDVASEFSLLGQGEVRHLTNEVFAELIPGAIASDLASRGLVDAYDITFTDSTTPPAIEASPNRPFGLTAIVHLLDSVESADAFMERGGVPPGEHMRQSERGAGVTGAQELTAPDIGESSFAIQVTNYDERAGREVTEHSVFWRRGPLVG